MACNLLLVKALATWAVKALTVTHVNQRESLFHSTWQNHCLFSVLRRKDPHTISPMLKGNHCIGVKLLCTYLLPVPKQHALVSGSKNKAGKTTEVEKRQELQDKHYSQGSSATEQMSNAPLCCHCHESQQGKHNTAL